MNSGIVPKFTSDGSINALKSESGRGFIARRASLQARGAQPLEYTSSRDSMITLSEALATLERANKRLRRLVISLERKAQHGL